MENTKPSEDIVLCQVFESEAAAYIARSVLLENGIRCIIDNQIFGTLIPIPTSAIGGFRLMVFRSDLPAAHRLLSHTGLA